MKRKRHTEEQIIAIVKEHQAGMKTADFAGSTGSARRASTTGKYGGLGNSNIIRHFAYERALNLLHF